jgi:hypothetical protein
MTLYAIHTQPDAGPEAIAITREAFSWTAFVFTPLWAIAHRLWLLLLAWLAIVGIACGLAVFAGPDAGIWTYLAFALWCGFASAQLIGYGLEKRGYIAHGEILAPDPDTAEMLWLDSHYGARV